MIKERNIPPYELMAPKLAPANAGLIATSSPPEPHYHRLQTD